MSKVTTKSRISLFLMWAFGSLAGALGFVLFLLPSAGASRSNTDILSDGLSRAWFFDIALERGIDFHHESGTGEKKYMPEIMSGGVCLLDYDQDGYLDVYFTQGGSLTSRTADTPGNRMFHNLGNGHFEDTTKLLQVGDPRYGMGCAVGDYNNDGRPDLYVTNAGQNTLYENTSSPDNPGFREVTARAGVGHPGFGSSAAFVDYNRDGLLDLFVVNYVHWSPQRELVCTGPRGQPDFCVPNAYKAPAPDVLYKNNGDGTFSDVTASSKISTAFGNGLGIACADFDGDSWVDVVVANDLLANQLWINKRDGTFEDHALVQGAAFDGNGVAESGMGVDVQDVDYDGDLDLLMTHFQGQTNTLYLYEGSFFHDRTIRMGLGSSSPHTGFGTAIMDFNNDALLDIYVADGRVTLPQGDPIYDDAYADENQIFKGLTAGGFEEVLPVGGADMDQHHSSRGAAVGDFDNDGDVDIFVSNRDGPAYLLDNRSADGNHWIGFRILNEYKSDAIGARVEIEFDGLTRFKDVRTAHSYCSSSDPRVHFGLGSVDRIERVTVAWANGKSESFGPYDSDQYITITRTPK